MKQKRKISRGGFLKDLLRQAQKEKAQKKKLREKTENREEKRPYCFKAKGKAAKAKFPLLLHCSEE